MDNKPQLTEVQILELECERLRGRVKTAEEQARLEKILQRNLSQKEVDAYHNLVADHEKLWKNFNELTGQTIKARNSIEKACPLVGQEIGRHFSDFVDRMCKAYIRLEEAYEALKTVKNSEPAEFGLRDLFVTGCIETAEKLSFGNPSSIANLAYQIADALIEERKTKTT